MWLRCLRSFGAIHTRSCNNYRYFKRCSNSTQYLLALTPVISTAIAVNAINKQDDDNHDIQIYNNIDCRNMELITKFMEENFSEFFKYMGKYSYHGDWSYSAQFKSLHVLLEEKKSSYCSIAIEDIKDYFRNIETKYFHVDAWILFEREFIEHCQFNCAGWEEVITIICAVNHETNQIIVYGPISVRNWSGGTQTFKTFQF
eukprot:255819_1